MTNRIRQYLPECRQYEWPSVQADRIDKAEADIEFARQMAGIAVLRSSRKALMRIERCARDVLKMDQKTQDGKCGGK